VVHRRDANAAIASLALSAKGACGTIEFKTRINNKNAETFIAGHIHQAPVGVAGPIVVPLVVPPAPPTSLLHIKQSGVATPNAGTTGADLCQDPGAYYSDSPPASRASAWLM
jgi:hypothetical protein